MPIGPAPPIRVEPADGEPGRQRLATTSSWLAGVENLSRATRAAVESQASR